MTCKSLSTKNNVYIGKPIIFLLQALINNINTIANLFFHCRSEHFLTQRKVPNPNRITEISFYRVDVIFTVSIFRDRTWTSKTSIDSQPASTLTTRFLSPLAYPIQSTKNSTRPTSQVSLPLKAQTSSICYLSRPLLSPSLLPIDLV